MDAVEVIAREAVRSYQEEITKLARASRSPDKRSAAPYGYRWAQVLVPEEAEQELLRRAEALRGEGGSDNQVATLLTIEGFKTRWGNPITSGWMQKRLGRRYLPKPEVNRTARTFAKKYPEIFPEYPGAFERTHCKSGHEFTEENTYCPPRNPKEKICRECMRGYDRRRRRQKNNSTAS